jgi:ABC-type multidrug transport system ATPase subunit
MTWGPVGQTLFSHLNLDFPAGVTWVCGGEGCGKTSLLRLLAGEVQAHKGSILVKGSVFWADPRSDAHEGASALAYFESVQARFGQWDANRLTYLTDGLGITEHLHKALYMLSTGTKRKVWLTAAFAAGCSVTLLDEPFAALDRASIAFVNQLLQEAHAQRQGVWVVCDYDAPSPWALTEIFQLDRSL